MSHARVDHCGSVTRELVGSGVTGLKELTDLTDAKPGPPDAVEIGAGVRAPLGVASTCPALAVPRGIPTGARRGQAAKPISRV